MSDMFSLIELHWVINRVFKKLEFNNVTLCSGNLWHYFQTCQKPLFNILSLVMVRCYRDVMWGKGFLLWGSSGGGNGTYLPICKNGEAIAVQHHTTCQRCCYFSWLFKLWNAIFLSHTMERQINRTENFWIQAFLLFQIETSLVASLTQGYTLLPK